MRADILLTQRSLMAHRSNGNLLSASLSNLSADLPEGIRAYVLALEFGFDGKTQKIENVNHAQELLKKAVQIYNYKNTHLSNHMMTPSKMHKQNKVAIKTWSKKKNDS